mgnify:CR=1 FL=1
MLKKRRNYNVIYLVRGEERGLIYEKICSWNLRCPFGLGHLFVILKSNNI